MNKFDDIEKQALCSHSSRSQEVLFGQRTGDRICNQCGKVFAVSLGENVIPVEYRDEMISSSHALMIALRINKNLKLMRDVKTGWREEVYRWAVVDKITNEPFLPVLSEIAESAVSSGFVKV
jgi:hypothetical protein